MVNPQPYEADSIWNQTLAEEKRSRQQAVTEAAKHLTSREPQEVLTAMEVIRQKFSVGKLNYAARPDAWQAPLELVLALFSHPDLDVASKAITTAVSLCELIEGAESRLAEALGPAIARPEEEVAIAAVTAVYACGTDAGSAVLPQIASCASRPVPQLQQQLCKVVEWFGPSLVPVVGRLAMAVVELHPEKGRAELLGAIVRGLSAGGIEDSRVAHLLCPPIPDGLAISLLRQLGREGRGVRLQLEHRTEDDRRPRAPLSVLQNPPRVIYPDGSVELIDELLYEYLSVLIEKFPAPESAVEKGFRSRDINALLRRRPKLSAYIARKSSGTIDPCAAK